MYAKMTHPPMFGHRATSLAEAEGKAPLVGPMIQTAGFACGQ